jgi:UDP-N-acetylglucosamine/UDP-N-acetylgalactosamine diphosphorylase
MNCKSKDKLDRLIQEGATIPSPEHVLIGDEVRLNRMAGKGVVIYPGCKIFGEKTLIMPGVKLGYEGPVTVDDCQIGRDVELRGGFFRRSVFLQEVYVGSGAQVREGCILEEQASGAHSVGLKQTILFPFVTLGSLINFCDCLMAGGTSRKNHSEVGSSYIHFNYSANQDKATPSLMGDVPRGVMLNQPPIFLGGQGGLVGPVRLGYGTAIAAGVVCRTDLPEGGKLVLAQGSPRKRIQPPGLIADFHPGVYGSVEQRVINNVHYMANLVALRQWYVKVRPLFLGGSPMSEMLHVGLLEKLDMAVRERIERFKGLAQKMPESAERYRKITKTPLNEKLLRQKQELFERWQDLEAVFASHLENSGNPSLREPFLEAIIGQIRETGADYVAVIQGLDTTSSANGTQWLQRIVDAMNEEALQLLPSFKCD